MVWPCERLRSGEFVMVYESESEGPDRKGKPLGRWKDRVEQYLAEREVLVAGKFLNRQRGSF